MSTLGEPNKNEALSIDARQKIDLKVGVAFARFQAQYFQGKYGNCFPSCLWFPLAETHRRASFGTELSKLWRKLTLPPRLEMSPLHGDVQTKTLEFFVSILRTVISPDADDSLIESRSNIMIQRFTITTSLADVLGFYVLVIRKRLLTVWQIHGAKPRFSLKAIALAPSSRHAPYAFLQIQ